MPVARIDLPVSVPKKPEFSERYRQSTGSSDIYTANAVWNIVSTPFESFCDMNEIVLLCVG